MADIKNIDIRTGMVFIGDDGKLYQCLDRDLNTPGNWRAMRLHLRWPNLKTMSITMNRVKPDDKVKLAYLDTRQDGTRTARATTTLFMDGETFDQVPLKVDFARGQDRVPERERRGAGDDVRGQADRLPAARPVELRSTETDPGIQGATAAAQTETSPPWRPVSSSRCRRSSTRAT